MDRAGEQVLGTTVSTPAAFYAGRSPVDERAGSTTDGERGDRAQVLRTGPVGVAYVPATARADSREIELEGFSVSGATKARDYNSSRSNKPSSEWWAGPDDDIVDDDDDADGILDVELELLGHVVTAQDAVERRAPDEAKRALDAFIDDTETALRPKLDNCGTGVCETVRENSDIREQGVRIARRAIADANWAAAVRELAGVEEIVLGDVERLDDVLVERRPGRPRFIDVIEYLRGTPTVGERFTVCLPDASLPGDLGSLAEELTLDRVLAYFAPSHEPDGRRTPFSDRYGTRGIEYDDEGCVRLDGPVSLHRDIACQTILSAELDTYRTENRAIVGFATEGGAVVSGAPALADTDGKRVFLVADDVTGEIILGEDRDMVMPGSADDGSVSATLVCPVAVTPADCPCPLPGLFYVRRIVRDDQLVFAGGWILDEGALYEDSVTLLFDEGPTEVASVTPDDIESDDFDDRVVEGFSRDRSRYGSAIGSARVQGTEMNKAELIEAMASHALTQTDGGRKGLNAVNVKVLGRQGADDDGDEGPTYVSATAVDAPLVHLAGAGTRSPDENIGLLSRGIDKKDIRRGM
ncbi:hypothetical protein C469_08940 [Halorubrum lipolyticum DSM 21995]|uniref:Uncharacterized protein n=1 Tax=Halorubrum lipolyticum DSM 21995 TaxID=1227482 RepID=M0NQH3_9EURY|nr:hypothetical protein C469_08940 [Halorubrum lipolyticum DSM 21995]